MIKEPKATSNDLFRSLQRAGVQINQEQKRRIEGKINDLISYVPTIGILGKAGVGKSSLCNALFGRDVAKVGAIDGTTRVQQSINIRISGANGINLIDVPGVGETESRNKEYTELYKRLLPKLDLILWMIKGDDRALLVEESFYKKLVRPHLKQGKPFMIVINQVDKIDPHKSWDTNNCQPSVKQIVNIKAKIKSVSKFFEIPPSKIVAVSATERYNLLDLVDKLVTLLPSEKKLPVARQVKKSSISKKTREKAEQGFWRSVMSMVKEVVIDIGASIIKKIFFPFL